MPYRRNDFDVTDRIRTTDVEEVCAEVCRIRQDLYQTDSDAVLIQAFQDFRRLYHGEERGYHACDTEYHDIQHVLDVTLAMARLVDGCRRETNSTVLDERMYRFGVITALFHDSGYIRRRKDTRHRHGAEYTLTHVSRGGGFLRNYFSRIGMGDLAEAAARTVHFTGYEMPIAHIPVDAEFRLVGNLLGSADLLAQMADRCYLEKCRDRLYPEFVHGGIARRHAPDGTEEVRYRSAADLIYQTGAFFDGAARRLDVELHRHYAYVEHHFGRQNLYWDEIGKNVRHAMSVTAQRDVSLLRRRPPATRPRKTDAGTREG